MRALALDPIEQTIAVTDVRCTVTEIGRLFPSRPRVAVRFPNGDVLLAAPSESTDAFTLGGSGPIKGRGIVVGRRLRFGDRAPARTALRDVVTMVRWTKVEKKAVPTAPPPPAEVRIVVIDPESRSIEEARMRTTLPSLEATIGAPPLLYFRIHDHNLYGSSGLAVRSAPCWRKEDLAFPGRVVIVGIDEHDTHLLDASIDVDMLRNTVKFYDAENAGRSDQRATDPSPDLS